MFLINSRSHHFIATYVSSIRRDFTYHRRTFSRSYGTILPSSFTRVLSCALVFSTCLPVSVCGTVPRKRLLRGFSWKFSINTFSVHQSARTTSHLKVKEPRICLRLTSTCLYRDIPSPGVPSFLRPPFAFAKSTGILTSFPSTTRLRLALGTD